MCVCPWYLLRRDLDFGERLETLYIWIYVSLCGLWIAMIKPTYIQSGELTLKQTLTRHSSGPGSIPSLPSLGLGKMWILEIAGDSPISHEHAIQWVSGVINLKKEYEASVPNLGMTCELWVKRVQVGPASYFRHQRSPALSIFLPTFSLTWASPHTNIFQGSQQPC